MKIQLYFLLSFKVIVFCSSCGHAGSDGENSDAKTDIVKITPSNDTFIFNYRYSGLGSNFGSMQPVLKVKGNKFIYTFEQNSYYKYSKRSLRDTICSGHFRTSSIDSILNTIKDYRDTSIHKANFNILSGGIFTCSVSDGHKKIVFELRNETDSTLNKIIDIVNGNIPEGLPKLFLINLTTEIHNRK